VWGVDTLRYFGFGLSDWLRLKGVPSFFRPDQLPDYGLTPGHLPTLLRYRAVVRVCRGLYHRVGGPAQHYPLAVACAVCQDSIVCLHSALQIYGIRSWAAPSPWDGAVWLAIRHRARAPRLGDLRVRIVRFSGTAWSFRVRDREFDGVPARITTPARTVADCFRLERLVGARAGPEALRDAIGQGLVTLAELDTIERALPCRRLRAALELCQQ
jgi:predicted transcriptional regulator of viral defense system